MNNSPDFVGRWEPRPAKESVPPNTVKQARAPSARANAVIVVAIHLDALGESSPPLGILLLLSPPELGVRRRRESAVVVPPAGEEDGEKEAVDERKGDLQRPEDGDYAVAGTGGKLIHLHIRRHRRHRPARFRTDAGAERERGETTVATTPHHTHGRGEKLKEATGQRRERERERGKWREVVYMGSVDLMPIQSSSTLRQKRRKRKKVTK